MKDAAIKQRETNIINADAFLTSTSSSAKHVSHFESASFNSFTTTGFIKTATLQHFALVSTSSQVRKPYDFNSEGSHASKICGCTKDLATDMGIFHLFVVFFCCKKNRRSETPTLFGAIYKGFVAAFSRNWLQIQVWYLLLAPNMSARNEVLPFSMIHPSVRRFSSQEHVGWRPRPSDVPSDIPYSLLRP